ncbi:MAG: hypothetical protein WAW61_07270 [Methylococcaceae bacterium]
MNADVSDDKNYHSVPVDERYQLPNDMDVNSVDAYKNVYLCSDISIRVDSESPYTIEALFLARTPSKFAANQNPAGQHPTVNGVIPACGYLLSKQVSIITCINLPVTAGVLI